MPTHRTEILTRPANSAPTVAGDRVYFGVRGGDVPGRRPPRLVALSAQNGKLLWEMDLEVAVPSAPMVAGEYLIFGTDQRCSDGADRDWSAEPPGLRLAQLSDGGGGRVHLTRDLVATLSLKQRQVVLALKVKPAARAVAEVAAKT